MCKRWLSRRKFFHPPKNVPNDYPEHYPPKKTMLRIGIWQIYWRMEQGQLQLSLDGEKVKNHRDKHRLDGQEVQKHQI